MTPVRTLLPTSPRLLLAAVVAASALVLPSTTASAGPLPATTSTSVATTTASTLAQQVLTKVNAERAKVGCRALRWDSRLARAARLHSQDMARYAYFSHTSRDGRSPWDRIRAQGYTAGSAENIAAGYPTASAVMYAWMHSKGHRANILNCSNRAIGVGVAFGGPYRVYWTQDFGRA